MAVLDSQNNNIVIRVVYDGPAMAGKTTSVRSLAKDVGASMVTPQEVGGRTLFFDWLDYTGGLFEGRRIRCQIVTVPGQKMFAPRRLHLLKSADAVVFVGDSRRGASSLNHIDSLRKILGEIDGPPVGIVMQANKRDQPDAIPIEELRDIINGTEPRVAIIESVATDGLGIREAFVFAVRLALDRVREMMRLNTLADGAPPHASADDLLSELRDSEKRQAEIETAGSQPGGPSNASTGSAAIKALDEVLREERNERPPSSDQARHSRQADGEWAPELPASRLPTGLIWPPVEGRLVLHEAVDGRAEVQRGANGDWSCVSGRWHIQTPHAARFATLEEGRSALIDWARTHAASSQFISSGRCIALARDGNAHFRLWQVVETQRSLRDQLDDATDKGVEAIAATFVRIARGMIEANVHWTQAPCRLPLSLRKIGMSAFGPRFVGLMPDPLNSRSAIRRSDVCVSTLLASELDYTLHARAETHRQVIALLERMISGTSASEQAILRDVVNRSRPL